MQFDILTLFPDLIHTYAEESILGRAQEKKLIRILAHNFRDDTNDRQRHVDDRPYGGGAGMILQVQPIFDCLNRIKAVKTKKSDMKLTVAKSNRVKQKIILMDPAGKKFDQRMAEKFGKLDRLVIICGRYEGFDARVHKLVDERVSVGEYVLAGGELPALSVVEAVSRLLPGVLGNKDSLTDETFGRTKLRTTKKNSHLESKAEYPQYTRPEFFLDWKVPTVLLSGDHKKIEDWRKKYTLFQVDKDKKNKKKHSGAE